MTQLDDLPCRQEGVDPDDWFAEYHSKPRRKTTQYYPPVPRRIDKARALCGTCPLRRECADEALDAGIQHGVWGGLDRKDREAIWDTDRERYPNGRPSVFVEAMDAALLPMLQARRDAESDWLDQKDRAFAYGIGTTVA